MSRQILTSLLLFNLFCISWAESVSTNSELWYKQPARTWMTEALPLGNGSLGGMFFGGTQTERVQFNHDTLWTGNQKATGWYQAFGDIFIQFGHHDTSDYRRWLDIDQSVFGVSYQHEGVNYRRTAFASHPAQVIVYHFTADRSAAHSGRIWLADMHNATVSGEDGRLMIKGRLPNGGLEYEAQLRVLNVGGTVRLETQILDTKDQPLAGVPGVKGDRLPSIYLVFNDCDSLTLVLAADTNYLPDHTQEWRGEHPHARVTERLNAIESFTVESQFEAHVKDYQSFFHRFEIDLGETAATLASKPTDQRLKLFTKNNTKDPDLIELFAQYGRYLLISCSREGSMPSNLQGLWNDSNKPPWRCDYHSNINFQMNYWPAEPTNLGELHRPFMDYVSSQIPISRQHTRAKYGENVRGWTVRTENGVFGGSSYKWNPPASAWYAQHYWEHYAFSMDTQYLAEVAYPVLKEVSEFWQDILIHRPDGTVVTPVGWSPEHGPDEEAISYDVQIVYDLFTNTIEAAHALDMDAAFSTELAALRGKLIKPKVGKWGQLQEWETDRDDPKSTHRHVSHLFGLHPGRQFTKNGTPKLIEAAKVSLNARGNEGTGWSRAWKINFWARLFDGDRSYLMLRKLLTMVNTVGTEFKKRGGVYPNMLDAHPPFQIDGNLGATAGIAEMLIQSQSNEIVLLPALPKAWPTGSVSGLRARGGFEVDIEWKSGQLIKARVTNVSGDGSVVRYLNDLYEVSVPVGDSMIINPK